LKRDAGQAEAGDSMEPNIGLSEAKRNGVVHVLGAVLADEYLLYTKTRNYHWNVTGPQFHDLHKFFEDQYEALDDVVDDVAERIRALGGWSPGSMTDFLKGARIREEPGKTRNAQEMLASLAADHEAVIRFLRVDLETCAEKYGDVGTNDFLTGLMEKHEKMAWMLRSSMEGDL
jgi:starvation-inducible DNA-binding protein